MNAHREFRSRVLIIDDSVVHRHIVRVQLRAEGFEVYEAGDGRAGVEIAGTNRPDLILLDIHLPGSDGFETIRQLKDDPQTRGIPVIFVSGITETAVKARGLDLGAVDFIAKPFESIELRARVRAALRTKSMQDLLEQRAHLDGLTGLGNRHAMEERLRSDWSMCRRRGTPLSVLIADLDRFKTINDRHGHPVGDAMLQGTARVLREAVRGGDFVARYGGEEFVVVAPDCDLAGAVELAERIRQSVSILRGPPIACEVRVTISVGASTSESDDDGPEALLHRADAALYRAKSAGRDAVWAYDRGILRPASSPPDAARGAVAASSVAG